MRLGNCPDRVDRCDVGDRVSFVLSHRLRGSVRLVCRYDTDGCSRIGIRPVMDDAREVLEEAIESASWDLPFVR